MFNFEPAHNDCNCPACVPPKPVARPKPVNHWPEWSQMIVRGLCQGPTNPQPPGWRA